MKTLNKIALALLLIVFLASCNKNYYSGNGKGGKNCGCPSNRGM
jgi:hypothetical protein